MNLSVFLGFFKLLFTLQDILAQTSGELRLAGGSASAGRLEIWYDGEWAVMCYHDFNLVSAYVACRQLGFATATAAGNTIDLGFPMSAEARLRLQQVYCHSHELRLLSCTRGNNVTRSCTSEQVAIRCTGSSVSEGDLRLVSMFSERGGSGGRLEIFLRGEWGTVCADGFGNMEGDVACRQLGYSSATSVGSVTSLQYPLAANSTRIWLNSVSCISSDNAIISCNRSEVGVAHCLHTQDVALECEAFHDREGDLRLGSSILEDGGRLEIFLRGEWGTICDNGFGAYEVDVACKQMGFTTGSRTYLNQSALNSSTSKIWLDGVSCSGIEPTLLSCDHRGIGIVENCSSHSQDVAIVCSDDPGDSTFTILLLVLSTILSLLVFCYFFIPICAACVYNNKKKMKKSKTKTDAPHPRELQQPSQPLPQSTATVSPPPYCASARPQNLEQPDPNLLPPMRSSPYPLVHKVQLCSSWTQQVEVPPSSSTNQLASLPEPSTANAASDVATVSNLKLPAPYQLNNRSLVQPAAVQGSGTGLELQNSLELSLMAENLC